MYDCFNVDNITSYNEDILRSLKDKIDKELEQREKQKETEAKKKIMKAIQDFLAAGYTLWIKGEVESEYDEYHCILGEVESVENKENDIILNFIEQT